MVRASSKAAVDFLEEEFESRNGHLKCMTSKGSVLDTIAFRSEESHDQVSEELLHKFVLCLIEWNQGSFKTCHFYHRVKRKLNLGPQVF